MEIAIALTNPKYDHNVGAALRACSCWGAQTLYWTGDRVKHPSEWTADELREYRLPREERMKGYLDVAMYRVKTFKEIIVSKLYTPVAVEIREDSQMLFDFVHPENPMYIFGPEDGGLDRAVLQHCHRFVQIPTRHCLNLAAAVNVVLAHRADQIWRETGEYLTLTEHRGFIK